MFLLGLVANKEVSVAAPRAKHDELWDISNLPITLLQVDRVFLVGHGDFLQQTVSSLLGPSGGCHDTHCKPSAALISRNTSLTNVYVTNSGSYLLGASNAIPHLVSKEPELITGGHPTKDGWER